MFPNPSIAPPALGLFQLSYGGLAFGGIAKGATYQLQTLTMDMPDIAAGDVQRAIDQGEFAGQDILPGREITIVQAVTSGYTATGALPTLAQAQALDAAVQALGGVLGPAGSTEAPLFVQMPSGMFACMARPRKHNCPLDVNRVMAGGTVATSLLHATDPRWYAAPSKTQTVGIPTVLGGLTFPITFPISFGGGGVGGLMNVVNAGKFECRPILIVTGPCTNPTITNLSIAGAPSIGVSIALNAGDTLAIDCDFQTIVVTSAGSTVGSSRRNSLMAGSTWWNLPANSTSQIELNTGDLSPVAGTLTVQSADAYLSL